MTSGRLPVLPLDEWRDTKTTLHLFSQIVGKVRLALNPRYNHWWHVPLYVVPRGLTTGPIPYGSNTFDLTFDFIDHQLVVHDSNGREGTIDLEGQTVASFYKEVTNGLLAIGVSVDILPKPFDVDRVGSDISFSDDTTHGQYDRVYVDCFHRILQFIEPIFREFRGCFVGKCSPVHFFWHSFDLAVTRFSGKPVELPDDVDPITRDAYSHEVISHGFWVGDDNLPEPAFYSYTHVEPDGLRDQKLQPSNAFWIEQGGASMAILKYNDIRAADDPRTSLLEFFQSSYEAGATLKNWPRQELELA